MSWESEEKAMKKVATDSNELGKGGKGNPKTAGGKKKLEWQQTVTGRAGAKHWEETADDR